MKKVVVNCPQKKPSKVCELVKEGNKIFMEIKYQNMPEIIRVDLTQSLLELGIAI
jgi:hypothetical protein